MLDLPNAGVIEGHRRLHLRSIPARVQILPG